MTTSITLHVFSSLRNPQKCLRKRRETEERKRRYSVVGSARKSLKIKGFLRGTYQNGPPISSQARYDHFDTPPRDARSIIQYDPPFVNKRVLPRRCFFARGPCSPPRRKNFSNKYRNTIYFCRFSDYYTRCSGIQF